MNLEQINDKHDIDKLITLTPFSPESYEKQCQFKNAKIFVETNVLESAEALEPWVDSSEK